ncbi:MAG: hypothetical protein RR922_07165 [Clostridia bacterium]
MKRRQPHRRLSVITDVLIVTMVLGVFLVISDFAENTKVIDKKKTAAEGYEENELKKPKNNIFTTDATDRTAQNEYIAKEILDKYNIDVYYGNTAAGAGSVVNGDELYDQENIFDNLTTVKNCLSKYPDNFFKEFKTGKNNYSISIYLIEKFNNDNIALATRNSNNDFKIYLSNREDLNRVFHHELFHIIEYYLQLEYNTAKLFENWNSYNPVGYEYPNSTKNIDKEFVHDEKYTKDNVFFVTRYAKTSAKEDRAEVFADLMFRENKLYYYSKGYSVRKKADLLASVLEDKFISVRDDVVERWEMLLQ